MVSYGSINCLLISNVLHPTTRQSEVVGQKYCLLTSILRFRRLVKNFMHGILDLGLFVARPTYIGHAHILVI
jgi:hypothetical protein